MITSPDNHQQQPLLVVKSGGDEALPEWISAFNTFMPSLVVKAWNDETVQPEQVDYVLVWQPDEGRIAQYKNIKAILSAAAGVDHILADKTIRADIPIVRMVTDDTVQRMSEFCTMSALMMLKDMPRIIAQQKQRYWQEVSTPHTAKTTTVGIMGLGALGLKTAQMLLQVGFAVRGWSRTLKTVPGITCFAGKEALTDFLSASDILICLLPDTADTRHILNQTTLSLLPQGASLINVARGGHVVMEDLIALLDKQHLSNALLDVFDTEPLPETQGVWMHPQIIVTPHSAATPSRFERARQAANTIAMIEAKQQPAHLYDRQKGY